jgi:nucleoside-diphosphate-sugar epimerase
VKQKKVLITGGNGFLGQHLVHYFLEQGRVVPVVFDMLRIPMDVGKRYISVQGDIRSKKDVSRIFENFGPFDAVYHLASAMPDRSMSDTATWDISVSGTIHIARAAHEHNVRSLVFTSSNVIYGIPASLPVTESTPLRPIEVYGRSKVQAERELAKFQGTMNIQIIRCPVITGVGRLGLQAILFEFISENRNVYVLGDGSNRYQFVDATDVCQALAKASESQGFDIYNIGGDGVKTMKELYEIVIKFANSSSRIVSLPQGPALFTLSLLDTLSISPLGIYQYSMLGRSMYADTTKIKTKLGWNPQKTIPGSFLENYTWYLAHKNDFDEVGRGTASSNRSVPKKRIFSLLKALS